MINDSLFEQSLIPMMIYDLESLQFLHVNEAAVQLYGYSQSVFLTMNIEKIYPEEDLGQMHAIRNLHNNGIKHKGIFRHSTHEGGILYVKMASQNIEFQGEKARLIQVLNVTDQVEKESEIKKIKTLKDRALNLNPDVYFLADHNFKIVDWNHQFELLSGYSPNEIKQLQVTDFFLEEDFKQVQSIADTLAEGSSEIFELRTINKHGKEIPFKFYTAGFIIQGQPYIAGFGHDLRKQKALEFKADREGKKFRETFEKASVGMAHVSPSGEWLRVNQKLVDILGYSREELLALKFQLITHPDDLDSDIEKMNLLKKGTIQSYAIEKRYLHKSGKIIWAKLTVSAVRNHAGDVEYFISVIEDITEKKQIKLQLEETSHLLEQTFQSLGEAVIIVDIPIRSIISVNRAALKIFGYQEEELTGQPTKILYHSESDFKKLGNLLNKHFEKHHRLETDLRLVKKDGTPILAEITIAKIMDQNQWNGKVVTVIRDVTELRKTQKALQKSEAQHRRAQRIAHLGHWVNNLETNRLEWSEETFNIFGLDPDTFDGTFGAFMEFVHPEDRELILSETQKALKEGTHLNFEHRIIRPDGEVRTILENAEVQYNKAGQPKTLTGTVLDITKRKQAENALFKALQEKELMLAEVHHRVKNNMALISALLHLQSMDEENSVIAESIERSQSRIQSIATVHEVLYQANELSHIPLHTALHHIITEHESQIPEKIRINAEDTTLNINQAVPFALLVNEILFELTHNYTNHVDSLNLAEQDQHIHFKIRFNGKQSHPYDVDDILPETPRLIVETLLNQLEAESFYKKSTGEFGFNFRKHNMKGSASSLQ